MQFQISSRRETDKEIPESSRLEFLEKFSANSFALSDAEDNTSGLLNRGVVALLATENTIRNLPKVKRAKFLGINRLFCFISICKLGSFKNPFPTITSLSELYFRIRTFILLLQMRKVISMNWQQQNQLKTMGMNEA